MGKQELDKDRVTSLLQSDEWEDDQTATTAATTMADSDFEEESEGEPEVAFEDENKYREPPAKPMYNGQGMCSVCGRAAGTCAQAAAKAHIVCVEHGCDCARSERAPRGSRSNAESSKVKVVTPDVAKCTVQSTTQSKDAMRTVHSNPAQHK